MGNHEGEAQESSQHHVIAAAGEGNQDDVGQGSPHLPHEEAGSLHAKEDLDVPPEPGPDDQVLVTTFCFVFNL